jgi:hypothetical protein
MTIIHPHWFWAHIREVLHLTGIEQEDLVRTHDAIQARENALVALQKVNSQNKELETVVNSLRKLRETDHLGESIEIAMMRKKR